MNNTINNNYEDQIDNEDLLGYIKKFCVSYFFLVRS